MNGSHTFVESKVRRCDRNGQQLESQPKSGLARELFIVVEFHHKRAGGGPQVPTVDPKED